MDEPSLRWLNARQRRMSEIPQLRLSYELCHFTTPFPLTVKEIGNCLKKATEAVQESRETFQMLQ